MLRIVMFAALSGCSFVMMNNPSDDTRSGPRCESGVVVPVIDIVGAVASVALASTLALAIRAEDGPALRSGAILGGGLVLGTMFATSSAVGFGRSRRCRHAIDASTAASR